jgi:hypothetical protein
MGSYPDFPWVGLLGLELDNWIHLQVELKAILLWYILLDFQQIEKDLKLIVKYGT